MNICANTYENVYEGLESEYDNLDQEIEKLRTDNNLLEQHLISLGGDIEKMTEVVVGLKKAQKDLSDNIYRFYRTAKTVIENKDRMIAELQQQSDDLVSNRTNIKPTTKDCNLNANNKPKVDDHKCYNRGSANNSQRKLNYKNRDRSSSRYSYDTKSSKTRNGRRCEERERNSRELHKKRSRESHDEYEEKHKLSRRKQSNEGRSDEFSKLRLGFLQNNLVREQILNMPKKSHVDIKFPKKKFKFVESMENKFKFKSLTPQHSFEEIHLEIEDFKGSKCNQNNADLKSKNEKSAEFSKHCSNQSINRGSEEKSENMIENRLKHSEIKFKNKSLVQTNLDNNSKLLITDCPKNKSNLEKDKYVADAVINEVETKTEIPNYQSRHLGTLKFNVSNLESVSSSESDISIVDEERSMEEGEIIDSTFIENLSTNDTKPEVKTSVENYFKPILDDNKDSCGSVKILENYCNQMHVDFTESDCENISTNDIKIIDVKNLDYAAGSVNSVENFKDILPVTHQNKESELISVLKASDSNNVDNVEITSDRSNISLLDTVEDKVTKYSDMKSILQQTLLNNCESADNMKELMNDNRDSVPDGQKITVLSNIVLAANTNIVKDINPRKIDATSELLQTINIGSENQSEKEHELLDRAKNEKNEIKKITKIDDKNETKNEMEICVENLKDTKIRRSTIIKKEEASSKNCQENSPWKENTLITKLPIDRIENETIAHIIRRPLSDNGNFKSSASLKISGKKSNSLENIKNENIDTEILLDNKLSHHLENANVSNRHIPDSSLLQDFNKPSIELTEDVRDHDKSLEKVENHTDSVIKSISSKMDVASCKSKITETELVKSPSDKNVLELAELKNPKKELIFEKLKDGSCAGANNNCKVSEGENSLEKLDIVSSQIVPLNHVNEDTAKNSKDSVNKGEQINKTLTEGLENCSKNSKSLERVEEQYSQDIDHKNLSAKLENITGKSKPHNEMETEQSSESGKASSYINKNTTSGDCKKSTSDKSEPQLLEKNVDQSVAKKVSFEMDKNKKSEKIKKASGTRVKQTTVKSETKRKKSKLNNKECDRNVKKIETSINTQSAPSVVSKKPSSKKLETTNSKSPLAIDNNYDESKLKMSDTKSNNISEGDKKSLPENSVLTSSKLQSPSEVLYGNVTKRKKGSSRNSKDNSDNNEQPLGNSDNNVYAKRRKGQKDSVEKLSEIETKNNENILNESIEKADKPCTDKGAPVAEEKCDDNKSVIRNVTISVEGENIEKDMILSRKMYDNQDVLDEKEIDEKGVSNIQSEPFKPATPTKPLMRRRITPTPVKDVKQVCSFANILEKNSIVESSPLHLTHEGEIPILHIEENNFNNVQVQQAFKLGDSNIMKLLDTMHLSNMDSELSKFKSNTSNVDTIEPTNQLENRLTFENIMDKITPVESERTSNVCVNVKPTEDTSQAVANSSSGNRKRRRICRVIVLE